MKSILFLLLILTSCEIIAQTGEKNFIDQNYIEVTGKSEMEIVPNQIYIKVLISEKDTKNKTTVPELEKLMLQKLQDIGIDLLNDISIKDIASNFKYYVLSKNEVLLSKQYQIIVKDGKTAGQVFIELEKIGVSNVSIEKLDNDKMDEYYKEVKKSAIKAARDKAEFLAIAINQNIGKAIFIQEQANRPVSYSQANLRISNVTMSSVDSNQSGSELEYEFEKIKIEFSVLCRFELK
jgi:uncharacterized protein YggE